MAICKTCGASFEGNFCSNCGAKKEESVQAFCTACGAPLVPDARFCGRCGYEINTGAAEPVTVATPVVPVKTAPIVDPAEQIKESIFAKQAEEPAIAVTAAPDSDAAQQRGQITEEKATKNENDTMHTVIKVFLILGCVAQGWLLLPLAWCLPITISIFRSMRDRIPITTGMKVCALLFVNLVAGICLLCINEDKN